MQYTVKYGFRRVHPVHVMSTCEILLEPNQGIQIEDMIQACESSVWTEDANQPCESRIQITVWIEDTNWSFELTLDSSGWTGAEHAQNLVGARIWTERVNKACEQWIQINHVNQGYKSTVWIEDMNWLFKSTLDSLSWTGADHAQNSVGARIWTERVNQACEQRIQINHVNQGYKSTVWIKDMNQLFK